MKRLISVSASDLVIKYTSRYYISFAHKYDVNCTIVRQKPGFIIDKYLLQLEGSEENIQNFIEYLKYEGFRV